ncbi:hypothetical protein [Sorangium sp. So ce693]|uniref:hypothetical protein n=1 Tax=Sorangium sp. So ce693 TaxID=3133318 RepID=UPI003F5E4928
MHLSMQTMYPLFYLRTYDDVRNAFGPSNVVGARRHFWMNGIREGRTATPFFDPVFYLENYPDLRQAFGDKNYAAAATHWIKCGIGEGRRGSRVFDLGFYLNSHPDLVVAFGERNFAAAFAHWKKHGHAERRATAPGTVLQIVAENFAFGDADRSFFFAGATAGDDHRVVDCVLGLLTLITDEGDGFDEVGNHLMHECLGLARDATPAEREIFRAQDRNQYEHDQAERNAVTA